MRAYLQKVFNLVLWFYTPSGHYLSLDKAKPEAWERSSVFAESWEIKRATRCLIFCPLIRDTPQKNFVNWALEKPPVPDPLCPCDTGALRSSWANEGMAHVPQSSRVIRKQINPASVTSWASLLFSINGARKDADDTNQERNFSTFQKKMSVGKDASRLIAHTENELILSAITRKKRSFWCLASYETL